MRHGLFSADTNSNKRAKWIEHLLVHPAYADYWANKWADLLRPKLRPRGSEECVSCLINGCATVPKQQTLRPIRPRNLAGRREQSS